MVGGNCKEAIDKPKRKTKALLLFFLGLVFLVGGSFSLFAASQGVPRLFTAVPLLQLVLGTLLAICAIKLHKRSTYFFFASFFFLTGFFMFLIVLQIIPVSLSASWPLLSVFAGLSLIPAGAHHLGKISPVYLLPAIFFVALGCVLLFFSLKLAPWSFKTFMLNYWPVFVLLAGFLLVLVSLVRKEK